MIQKNRRTSGKRTGATSSPKATKPKFRGGKSRGGSAKPSGSRGGSRRSGGGRRGGKKMPTFDPSQFINKNPVSVSEEVYKAKNTFATFGLDDSLVETIHAMGITVPSPIQDQIILEIMSGHDVVGLAETGTGKTAAFLVPLIQKTINNMSRMTLVLTPTRELAIQIEDELQKLTKAHRMNSAVCVGGVGIGPQIRRVKQKNQFIIGTPGRVMDLMDRGVLRTQNITTIVLDEADRMLDMGFIHDMRKIMDNTPPERETHFFSATMAPEIKKLVSEFLTDPVTVSVKKKDVTNSIEQDIVQFKNIDKFETLHNLLEDKKEFNRVIIFGSMKHSVERLSKELTDRGIRAESIHGNKSHGQRQRSLQTFKSGRAQVLVATDVAARGIHVDDVTHVINYDLPNTFDDYVHRIGRTGRGTKKGKALTFVPED